MIIHDASELLSLMEAVPVAAVAGEGPRVRMMHYATDQ